MSNPNDLGAYRKKKQKRNNLIKLLLVIIFICGFALVYFYRDIIFEPLRGIASKINYTTDDGEGFPVHLPGSASYEFMPLGDCFTLLTDTYFYTYSGTGKQIFALQHGYVSPVAKANSKRVLIFDKGAHKFSMYNKTSEIYTQSIEEENIVSAFISDSEKVCVVTYGGNYANTIYIYNGNGQWQYTHRFVDENVMQVAFTDDEQSVIVSTITAQNGEVFTNIYRYNINSDEKEMWKTSVKDLISLDMNVNGDKITVFGDTQTFTLNTENGTESGTYAYSRELEQCKTNGILSAILFKDKTTNKNVLVSLDEKSQVISTSASGIDVSQIIIEDNMIYTLEGSKIICYNNKLEKLNEVNLSQEYSAFVKIGNKVYLLGYDVVQEVSL